MWTGKYTGRTTSDAGDLYASGPITLAGREHELVVGTSLSKRSWENEGRADPNHVPTVTDYYGWNGNVAAPAWGATPSYTNNETTHESGLYGAMRWNLRDDLKPITGVRIANYKNAAQDQRETGVVVPYVGAVYDLSKEYSVYASTTSIFAPQSKQTEAGSTLRPVEGNNMEVGVKAELLGGRVNASAAVFQLEQDNFGIETAGVTSSGGTAYRAVTGVKTRGFEIAAAGQLTTAWQLFDKKYYTIFNWYSTYTWGERRNVTVSLNYKF